MEFYHVLAAVAGEQVRVLFSDLSLAELKKRFVTPYKRGDVFFCGNELIMPAELWKLRLIKTSDREQIVRERLSQEDLRRIDEFNRSSQGIVIFSPGAGYEPADLADGGIDVTRDFIVRGPGSSTTFLGATKATVGWILGILASVFSAGLAKWFGWV